MLTRDFLYQFKQATEKKWSTDLIDPNLYGFQFQRGTRWNSGLSDKEIMDYEGALGAMFSPVLKKFVSQLNGTDLPTVNIYGNCGEPKRESVGVYCYPRDLKIQKDLLGSLNKSRQKLAATMSEQGFDLRQNADLVPFYGHRYVVCLPKLDDSVVLSIDDCDDAIVYANSFEEYLKKEFLSG
jgi:hypothetical protein